MRLTNPIRAFRIWCLQQSLAQQDADIAAEERRHETHYERMRAWRAHRQMTLGRILALRGRQGSVIWSGMARR